MDLQRKLEIVENSISHITRADDQDSAIRSAALDSVDRFVAAERKAMADRLAAKIKTHIAQPEQEPA